MFFLLRMTDPASNQGSDQDLRRQRRREYMKAYYQTPEGKASLEKYRASVKGKKAVARAVDKYRQLHPDKVEAYETSPERRAAKVEVARNYRATRQDQIKAYEDSPERKAAKAAYAKAYRARKKAEAAAKLNPQA